MGSGFVFLPEIILVTAALTSTLLGFAVGRRTQFLWGFALTSLVLAMVLTFDMMGLGLTRLLGLNLYEIPVSGTASGDFSDAWRLRIDTFTLYFHIVFMFVALLAVIASRSFIRSDEPHQGEYYGLLFLAVVGMMFTAAATDLFVLYLAFEISSISTFALVAFRKRDRQATEAALKFFIFGSIASAIILFGISIVYGVAGSTGIAAPGQALTDLELLKNGLTFSDPRVLAMEAPLLVAIVFLVAGFGFKVAIVPFHMWAPDVYQGSPTTISAFLAAGSKKVGIVALFKVFLVALLSIQVDWLVAIAILAIVTQTVGNLFAIPQRNIKRMLAYSSIAQVGYIMIAVAVGAVAIEASGPRGPDAEVVAIAGVQGGLYHVLTHAIMKAGAFLVVAATAMVGIGEEIGQYKGLSRRMPFVSLAMAVFLLSLAGIPPFGGFFSKFILFSSAVSAMTFNPWYLALAVSGVLNSALSLYYYARVIWYMWVLEPEPTEKVPLKESTTAATGVGIPFFKRISQRQEPGEKIPLSRSMTVAIGIAFVLIWVTGLAAFPFISYLEAAARAFFGF